MDKKRVVIRRLKEKSERIKVTISPANYSNNEKGEIVLKNSPRMRLMLDKNLIREQGYASDRIELIKFDEERMLLIFKPSADGNKLAPIKKGSGKADISVPLSKLKTLEAKDFPQIKREPCAYRFLSGYRLAIILPLGIK